MVSPRAESGDARMLRRVRWRLVGWSAGSTLVLLLVLGGALYFSVDASLNAAARTQLQRQADDAVRFLPFSHPDGNPLGDVLDGDFDDAVVLGMRQGRALTRGAAGNDSGDAASELGVDEPAKCVFIQRPILPERGHEGCENTSQIHLLYSL